VLGKVNDFIFCHYLAGFHGLITSDIRDCPHFILLAYKMTNIATLARTVPAFLRHEMSQKRRKCHKIIDLYCRKTKNRNNMTFRVKLRHSHWLQLSLIEL
jgi:hypothetical protein